MRVLTCGEINPFSAILLVVTFLQKLTASVVNHFRSKLSLPAIPRFFSLISADCLHNQITTTLQKHSHKKSQVICSPFPCTKTLFYQTAFFVHLPKQSEAACSFFLSNESRRAGRSDFTIHYDRQQLADYLNVDRTALSKELSKMRDDGLISFRKNQFSIKSPLHE